MMIDRLESRTLFANIAGYVYNDADASKTFDAGEKSLRGTTVFLDANANGQFDAGEQSTTANRSGYYQFTGLTRGDYVVGTTTSTSVYTSTTATPNGTRKGRFDIQINGLENATPSVKAAFEYAKTRWEGIIMGDMPDVQEPGGRFVDDLVIDASIVPIDGAGENGFDIFGQAAPTAVRPPDQGSIPYAGIMQFDSYNLKSLQLQGTLNDVILHEMGHVLGFGSIWRAQGLSVGLKGRNPRFIGENAVREYNKLFGLSNLSVPIEGGYGAGSRNSHWSERRLQEELMTPDAGSDSFYDANGNPVVDPLSRITVGQFDDEGYTVNYDAADVWNPTTHVTKRTLATDYGGVANERRISVATHDNVTDLDFGYVTVTSPAIRVFSITPNPVAAGNSIRLNATGITDADADVLQGVSFYRETNGTPGLQRGSDKFLGQKSIAKNRVYALEVNTTNLSGDQRYYAVAVDSGGRTGLRTGTVNVEATTLPEAAPSGLSVRIRNSNTARVAFVKNDTTASLYRIQVSVNRNFSTDSLVEAFDIASDATGGTLTGLLPGKTYYVRVRAANLLGSTEYSQPISFETI